MGLAQPDDAGADEVLVRYDSLLVQDLLALDTHACGQMIDLALRGGDEPSPSHLNVPA